MAAKPGAPERDAAVAGRLCDFAERERHVALDFLLKGELHVTKP